MVCEASAYCLLMYAWRRAIDRTVRHGCSASCVYGSDSGIKESSVIRY